MKPPLLHDGISPTPPVVRVLGALDTKVALIADPSTDNEIILAYRWERSDGSGWTELITQNILMWVDEGLEPGKLYQYRVTAIDWSGMESEPAVVEAQTLVGLSNKIWYVRGYNPLLDTGTGETLEQAWNGPRRVDWTKILPGDTLRVLGNCRADTQLEGRFHTMPKGICGVTIEGVDGIISGGTNSIATTEADFDGPPVDGIYVKSNTGHPGWLWSAFDDHLPGHLPPQVPFHQSKVPLTADSPENSWYWDGVEKKMYFKALGGLDGKLPFRSPGDSVMVFNEASFCTVKNVRVAYSNGFNLLNSAAIAFENVDMHMGMWMAAQIRNCIKITFDGGEWSWFGSGIYGWNDKKDHYQSSFCSVRNIHFHDTIHDPLAFERPDEIRNAYHQDSHCIGWQNGTDLVFEDNVLERCNSAFTIWMGGWMDGSTRLHNRQDAMSRITIRRNTIRECRLKYSAMYDWVNAYSALGRGIEIVGSNWANSTTWPKAYLNAGNARDILITENDIRGCDRGSIYLKVGTFAEGVPSAIAGNNYLEQRIEYSTPDNRVIGNTPPLTPFYVNEENAHLIPTRSGGYSALSDNYGPGADMLINGDIRYAPEYMPGDLYTPPTFKDGHTMMPLTRCGWGTPYNIGFELEENWGYALDLSHGGYYGERYTDSKTLQYQIIQEIKRRESEDGRRRKIYSYTQRPVYWDGDWQQANYIGDILPEEAWMHVPGDAPVEQRRIPVGAESPPAEHRRLELSPLMSDEAITALTDLEKPKLEVLKQQGIDVDITINMAEYSPGVPGHSNTDTKWRADPNVLMWWNELQAIPYDGSAYYPDRVPGREAMMELEHQYVSGLYEAKNKLEPAVRAACKSVYPNTTYINYGTGDCGEGILSWRPRSAWGFPYWMAKRHTDLPSWEFYRGYHAGWMDGDKNTIITQTTNSAAIQTEGGNGGLGETSNISYNWIGMGWSNPAEYPNRVAPDIEQFGYLKLIYILTGCVGNVIGYFQQPLWETGGTHPAWLDDPIGPGDQDWVRQCLIAGHVHAMFSHLENYIRDGDVLPGDGQHHLSRDVYSRPVWPHASYEFAHELGTPTTGALYKTIGDHSDNPEYPVRAHVAARKLRGAEDYLVCGFSSDGVTRALHPTIPGLGRVTVAARPGGTIYRMRPGMAPVMLDPIADDPSRYVAQLLET